MRINKDFIAGMRGALPILIGVIPFAMITGVAAVSVGLTLFETMGMSVLVFAGASQLVVFQLISAGSPWIIMVLTAWVVNLRFTMYSATLAPYFEPEAGGHLIDQAWQPRLTEGMVRAYLVGDRVAGFGQQAINALHPSEPQPGPRLYHGPDDARFQGLRDRLESAWVAQLCACTGLASRHLPLLWDCDFLFGGAAPGEPEHHVLCEINVSSVSPFPPSCIAPLVGAVLRQTATT